VCEKSTQVCTRRSRPRHATIFSMYRCRCWLSDVTCRCSLPPLPVCSRVRGYSTIRLLSPLDSELVCLSHTNARSVRTSFPSFRHCRHLKLHGDGPPHSAPCSSEHQNGTAPAYCYSPEQPRPQRTDESPTNQLFPFLP
jgi:hypothetical protein